MARRINTEPRVRVMLVDDDRCRLARLQEALDDAGNEVVAWLGSGDDLLFAVEHHQPDVILIDVNSPSRDTLESLNKITRERPRPILLFSDQGDTETIRRAIQAGVSAYVVDGLVASRLKALIEVAIAQFEVQSTLQREVDEAKARLTDRDDIDCAKQVLMRRLGMSESAAYERLRRLAMDRKLKLGDVARAVLAVSDEL
jgi:two-component system, response regulator / RNA-binding antiterminator